MTSTAFVILIGGHETTVGLIGSAALANRDPERFADPTEFRPGRPQRHIAFGIGHTARSSGR